MNEIIPAIIPQDLNTVKEKLDEVLGLVKKVQIDILDGEYAEVKTWPFNDGQMEEMKNISSGKEKFPHIEDFILEMDMMVLNPTDYLKDFISMGAKSFVIHTDFNKETKECIEMVKGAGCQVGLGIKPAGDISILESFLPEADFVQFMGSDRIGHSGIELDEDVFEKIKTFHDKHPDITIQIDIGVNEDTIPKLKAAGVSQFVSGSSIFGHSDPEEAIIKLQNI